ncbi:hypothetical protein CsSME_00015403 [Camellia sinensis var. sinensis]
MKMPRQLKRHANSTPKKKQMQTTPKKKNMNGLPEQISDSPIQSGNTTQSIPDVLLEAKIKAETYFLLLDFDPSTYYLCFFLCIHPFE